MEEDMKKQLRTQMGCSKIISTLALTLLSLSLLAGCTYNPFTLNNHTTGNPVAATIGAGVGAGGVALLGGSKATMVLAGLAGGAIGYYISTLRYAAGGIMHSRGKD